MKRIRLSGAEHYSRKLVAQVRDFKNKLKNTQVEHFAVPQLQKIEDQLALLNEELGLFEE